MLTLNDGRSELFQWDTGRKLTVDTECSQVHFSNKVFGRSIDVDVVDGVAIIPDVLLQADKDLNVWAFVGKAENGYTKISKTFKVNRRNKPADYVFTPVEQTTIAEIAAIAKSVRDDADAGLFDGKPGENGRDGIDGKDGKDGYTPKKGVDYFDGAPGADGKTPEYGVDYGTPEQIAGIAKQAAEILQPDLSQIKGDISELGFNELTEQKDIISAQGITLTLADDNSIWNSSGSITTNVNYYRAINEPIPVESGKTYIFKNLYGDQYTHGQLMFFDSSMKNGFIVGVTSNLMEYTVPDGKYYVCLTLNSNFASNIDNVEIIGDIGTGKFKSENMVFTYNQILQVVENIPNNSIDAKKTDFAEYVDYPDWVDTTNMLDDTTWGASGYMRHTNGQLVTSEYTTNYIASDFIAVVPEYKYRVEKVGRGCTLYVVYFSDLKNDGTSVKLGWITGGEPVEFTVPSGKTYVSFNCEDNGTNNIEGLYRRTQLENEKGISIPRLVVDRGRDKPLYGKTIVNFGDSIFGQARPPYDISTFLADETGAIVHNCGFGGCQMSWHASASYLPFSMYKLVDAIVDNDWTEQDEMANGSNVPAYFKETVELLKSIDFSKVDIVTIGYGINDFNNGASLDYYDSGNPFYDFAHSMRYSIEKLQSAFPNLRIFICTMTYGFATDGSGDTNTFTHKSWVGNEDTNSYLDFIAKQIEIAKSFQLPIIDNYYDLGINSFNKLQYFSSGDGTHQTLEGRKLIAKHMAKCLW